jgi:hypothetical protein
MKHRFHYIIIALVAILTACSTKTDVPQVIDDAEQLANAGKYADAIELCDRLVTSSDSSALSATQLCRIGVIYATAADNDIDNDTNTARAMHSFISAYAINRDSVTTFVDNLNIDRLSAVRTVLQLMRNTDDDPSKYESIDDLEEYAAQMANEADLDSIYNEQ